MDTKRAEARTDSAAAPAVPDIATHGGPVLDGRGGGNPSQADEERAFYAKEACIWDQVSIQVETWEAIQNAISRPWRRHHGELVKRGTCMAPLAPDVGRYRELMKSDLLHCAAARAADDIVGFFFWLTVPHFHMSTTRFAMAHLLWVAPEIRGHGIGSRLYEAGWAHAAKFGCQVLVSGAKVGSSANSILERDGFRHTENIWMKRIA